MIIHLQEDMSGLYKNEPKVYNKYNIIKRPTRAQGGKTHLPAESGPEREENKDKPKSNHFFSAKALHRPTLEAQRRSPTEDGLIRPRSWVDWPPTSSVRLELWLVGSHRLTNIGCMGTHEGFGPEDGGLLKIGRHARKHNSTPSPPSILWWFDPMAKVKMHTDH